MADKSPVVLMTLTLTDGTLFQVIERPREHEWSAPVKTAVIAERVSQVVDPATCNVLTRNDVTTLLHSPLFTDDERIEVADQIKRADYFRSVHSIAADALAQLESGELADTDALTEYVDQSCDASHWTIYTYANFEVLRWSDNSDAYTEEYGEPPIDHGDIQWSAMAYAALRADVMDIITATIDANEPFTCKYCEKTYATHDEAVQCAKDDAERDADDAKEGE